MSSWICSRSISKVGHSGRLLFSKGLVWKACSLGAKWGELKHRLPFSICKGWAWVGNVSWSASCREKLGELHPPPTPPPPHPKKKIKVVFGTWEGALTVWFVIFIISPRREFYEMNTAWKVVLLLGQHILGKIVISYVKIHFFFLNFPRVIYRCVNIL